MGIDQDALASAPAVELAPVAATGNPAIAEWDAEELESATDVTAEFREGERFQERDGMNYL